ncbi:unnamed protein product [Adineta steineri]|uniref:Uncharacterized protein n=1 Tax=Adineta steineri TaxID=433720 RepID=A0A818VJU9_9BILA|nr:unnamed protein product [Adineta steineri]
MTYHIKREHLKNWDLQPINENPIITTIDDDQDIYISERSSMTSSNDTIKIFSPITKQTPTPSSRFILPKKPPHTLKYPYNKLPEDGIPAAIHYQLKLKNDKKLRTTVRKAPPGQGNLVPIPPIKPVESSNNYYPYWYYYKMQNPDWIMRQRRTADGQIIPYDSFDPSKYLPAQSEITTSPPKPKKRTRKYRPNDVPVIQSNQDKERVDYSEKNLLTSSHLMLHEDQQQVPLKHYIPLNDIDNNEHREQKPKRKILQQRSKPKIENERNDHNIPSLSNKPSYDLDNLMIVSKPIENRSKNQSKLSDKHTLNSNIDDNGKRRHHHHHHHQTQLQNHHHPNQTHSHIHPSIPSQQNHSHQQHHRYPQNQTHSHNNPHILSQQNHQPEYYQQHVHIRRRPLSSIYVNSDVQIVDILFKDPVQDDYHLPPPASYSLTHPLPPVTHDHHHQQQQQKTNPIRFPTDNYGALNRQTHGKNGKESIRKTKIYKSDLHTLYSNNNRVHNLVDKRLAV